jgi:enamine deaminase RidA (YjgF/YER057c/UK114 family)
VSANRPHFLSFLHPINFDDTMSTTIINPAALGAPRGYSNGMLAPQGGRMLFISGQVAWDSEQKIVSADFAEQFAQCLRNVMAVITQAGGRAESLMRLTIFVCDKQAYLAQTRTIGASYRSIFGKHFPAMSLVQVAALLEDGAQVEIEATAWIEAQ